MGEVKRWESGLGGEGVRWERCLWVTGTGRSELSLGWMIGWMDEYVGEAILRAVCDSTSMSTSDIQIPLLLLRCCHPMEFDQLLPPSSIYSRPPGERLHCWLEDFIPLGLSQRLPFHPSRSRIALSALLLLPSIGPPVESPCPAMPASCLAGAALKLHGRHRSEEHVGAWTQRGQ